MIKVLVITLYCGENEFPECCESVKSQIGIDVTHKVIENLPKQEAHQELYRLFNENYENYHYFAKLDADMVFSGPQSLRNVIDNFRDGIDVVSATVHDGITDSDMQSFNVFSSKCYFDCRSNDPLFTDKLLIEYPGSHYSYVDECRNVLHAFNPSPFQAFMFGVHRAQKVVQPGSRVPSLNNSFHQQRILNKVFKRYRKTASEDSRQALLGATLVFRGVISDPSLFRKSDYIEVHEDMIQKGVIDIDDRLSRHGFLSLLKILGWKRFLLSTINHIVKKVNN